MALVCPVATIGPNIHPMAAASGIQHSSGSPLLGDACSIVPAHRHGHQNVKKRWCIFSLLFCLLSPWRPPGQYGEIGRPMAASSGFRYSPGHVALGDAHRIALAHSQGLQNTPRQWYIFCHRRFCHQP
jgi:hypothetical protein